MVDTWGPMNSERLGARSNTRSSCLPLTSRLYLSHALSRWGNRMWEFAVVMLLLHVSAGSLRLVSIHGILEAAAVALSGPVTGRLVDHTGRETLLTSAIVIQNAALLGGAGTAALLTITAWEDFEGSKPSVVWSPGGFEWALSDAARSTGVVLLMCLSALSSVAALCRNLAIHRDWVVVLADSLCVDVDGPQDGEEDGEEQEKDPDSPRSKTSKQDEDSGTKAVAEEQCPESDRESGGPQEPNPKLTAAIGSSSLDDPEEQEVVLLEKDKHSHPARMASSSTFKPGTDKCNEGDPSRGIPEATSARDRTLLLGSMNATLTRIDLFCRLAAPALTGLLMTLLSLPSVCVVVACWNAVSLPLELWLAQSVYSHCPQLHGSPCSTGTEFKTCQCRAAHRVEHGSDEQTSALQNPTARGPWGTPETVEGEDTSPHHKSMEEAGGVLLLGPRGDEGSSVGEQEGEATVRFLLPVVNAASAWWREACLIGWTYLKQPCLLPGLALALLYLNVMSFGDIMTAYLRTEGVPVLLLGFLSAFAAVTGLAGTFLFPVLLHRFGLSSTSRTASLAQWSCLVPSVAAALLTRGAYPVSPWVLVGSVISSRLGLWMFDISALQMVQESVPPQERGQVGGVQDMLQQGLQMLSFIMCVVVDDPLDFWIPVIVSFAAVTLSCFLVHVHILQIKEVASCTV